MKKMRKSWILIGMLAMAGVTGLVVTEPSFADSDDGCVETSIISNKTDENSGEKEFCDKKGTGKGVYKILNIILTVLTYGVGIAATAGMVIVGIQYATAGTNEAQVAKAKKRILEIVIGIVAYAVLYAALNWLLPGGIFNNS